MTVQQDNQRRNTGQQFFYVYDGAQNNNNNSPRLGVVMVTGVNMGTTGRRISGARKARGLTQQSLADKMGVGRSTIANWEIDKVIPEAPSLLTLSTILGVNARWLLMQEENPTPHTAVTPDESALLNAFRNLSETGKEALRAYLGYLSSQDSTQAPTASQPFPKARTKSK